MTPLQIKASSAFNNMRNRCYNTRSKDYRSYGGKGVEVRVTKRDFMSWYIHHGTKFVEDNPGVRYAVGRVDHDSHYTFSNMEILSCSANTKEMVERHRYVCCKCKEEMRIA